MLTGEYQFPQVLLAVVCLAYLAAVLSRDLVKKRKSFAPALPLYRSSLGGWICMGTALILALFIGQITLENQLRPWLDNQLRGEMHLLHEVKDSPPEG